MKLTIEIGDQGPNLAFDYDDHEPLATLIQRIDADGHVDGLSLLEDTLGPLAPPDLSAPIGPRARLLHRLRSHRTCIALHYETESASRWFPTQGRWAAVHRWGCRQFDVARDACAHLELHLGSPDGPALNEHQPIGEHTNCLTVWFVAPGPEPFGG